MYAAVVSLSLLNQIRNKESFHDPSHSQAKTKIIKAKIAYCTLSIRRLEVVFVVANIKASTLPFVCIISLILLLRKHEGFHSLSKGRVIFLHVHNVEPILMTFLNVVH